MEKPVKQDSKNNIYLVYADELKKQLWVKAKMDEVSK